MGRIPRSDWSSIYDRYRKGVKKPVLAAPYGVTTAAITYVIKQVAKRRGHIKDTGPKITVDQLPQLTVFDVPRTPPKKVKGRRRRPRAWEYPDIFVPKDAVPESAPKKGASKPTSGRTGAKGAKRRSTSTAKPAARATAASTVRKTKPAKTAPTKAAPRTKAGRAGNGHLGFGAKPARARVGQPLRGRAPATAVAARTGKSAKRKAAPHGRRR